MWLILLILLTAASAALLSALLARWSEAVTPAPPRAPARPDPRPAPPTERPPPPESPVPLFVFEALEKVYATPHGPIPAVHGAWGAIGGGVTAIVGPSGEGKTTLLNLLGGLDEPTAGEVWFQGEPVPFGAPKALRRYRSEQIACVFQHLNLIGHLNALENVALPLLCRGTGRAEALRAAREALAAVRMDSLAARRPDQLSGGQQQRVAIARAVASRARVILCDEPTGNLDPANSRRVMRQFRNLSRRLGVPVVVVTHDHRLARRYADRILVCKNGRVRVHGGPRPAPGTLLRLPPPVGT